MQANLLGVAALCFDGIFSWSLPMTTVIKNELRNPCNSDSLRFLGGRKNLGVGAAKSFQLGKRNIILQVSVTFQAPTQVLFQFVIPVKETLNPLCLSLFVLFFAHLSQIRCGRKENNYGKY